MTAVDPQPVADHSSAQRPTHDRTTVQLRQLLRVGCGAKIRISCADNQEREGANLDGTAIRSRRGGTSDIGRNQSLRRRRRHEAGVNECLTKPRASCTLTCCIHVARWRSLYVQSIGISILCVHEISRRPILWRIQCVGGAETN